MASAPGLRCVAACAGAVLWLAGCGGGGGGGAVALRNTAPATAAPQHCSANNPYRGDAESTALPGTLADEKAWLHDYFDARYLWFQDVPAVDAGLAAFSNEADVYGSLDAYFDALRSPALTPSGKRRDAFSFTIPSAQWRQFANQGALVGYGIEWFIGSQQPPRNIRIALVHAGSPADAQGLRRGDSLVSADGVSADVTTRAGVEQLNAALFPTAGGQHRFQFTRRGAPIDSALSAAAVRLASVSAPAVLDAGGQKVGYLAFHDHVRTAEQPLVEAFTQLRDAGVADLILDLRYNGGGYLYIASAVAYMIAGPARTSARVFERSEFSAKRQGENTAYPFSARACLADASLRCTSTAPLPTLNLGRVTVLTSSATCSASEAIINGLRGVDVDVRLVGSTTCGKPYGFFGQDNCGVSYFAVEFQGANAKGFADYADGFVPGGNGAAPNQLPGCTASDDFERELGDPTEGQLATALHLHATGVCPPAAGRAAPLATGRAGAGFVTKQALRNGRYGAVPAR